MSDIEHHLSDIDPKLFTFPFFVCVIINFQIVGQFLSLAFTLSKLVILSFGNMND